MEKTTIRLDSSAIPLVFRGHRGQVINVGGSKRFTSLEAAATAAARMGLLIGSDGFLYLKSGHE